MEYPEYCAVHGESLDSMGMFDVGFDRATVLGALELLSNAGAIVLGGDVLRRTVAGLEHTYDSWYFEPTQSKNIEQASLESIAHSRRYVLSYPDPGDGSILYRLVIGP
jgi:hypothetical protein